mgnify:CR=1 FL=1
MAVMGTKQMDGPEASLETLMVGKRDGRCVEFDRQRITDAVAKAFEAVHGDVLQAETAPAHGEIDELTSRIESELVSRYTGLVQIYEIQSVVEHVLLESGEHEVAKAYIDYRVHRDLERSKATDINHTVGRLISKDSAVVNENAN